ncbi:MAG: YkgJ family cysteine cluster protein [Leptospirales bacterium]|nr:YkgJ family cysteine cluster protein [Leptospirales bacterium]
MSKIKCKQCGACCIAFSITSPIPGMAGGKIAGERCINLDQNNLCSIYPERPLVCVSYAPSDWLCGDSFEAAMQNIAELERTTESPYYY